jgi:hypothetical protein
MKGDTTPHTQYDTKNKTSSYGTKASCPPLLVLAWSCLTSCRTSSKSAMFPRLTSTLQLCIYTDILYKASAGLEIVFPSMANLLRMFQSVQHRAAKVNQASLRRGIERPWARVIKSPTPVGFQLHGRSSLTPTHMKRAKWHLKKMWLPHPPTRHKAHNCHLRGLSPSGHWLCRWESLPCISCQRKTLIFGGNLVRQTSLK